MNNWDYSIFWQESIHQVRQAVDESTFDRWLRLTEYRGATEDALNIIVPSAFYRDQISVRYQHLLENALKEIAGRDLQVKFEVGHVKESAPVETREPVKTKVLPEQSREQHLYLREDFKFERYIVGDNNRFAANAAVAISRNPGKTYNPFFVYGGVGLGKTHLMQAIGNYIHATSRLKVIYVTSEYFTTEFIESIREGKMPAFKNKYRFTDVLLIDDIQFLENKWETQMELFHTFNALRDANKQLVFTCDKPASQLKHIEERLRSRFENGLNVDIQPPDYETRCAILNAKMRFRNFDLPADVITFIAKTVTTNVRDLEAALTKLSAYAELMDKPVTLEVAQNQLGNSTPARRAEVPAAVSVRTIQEVVAAHYHVSIADMQSKKRRQDIVLPRQIALYLAREISGSSGANIGEAFGGRDYTTVMRACKKVEERLRNEKDLGVTLQTLAKTVAGNAMTDR